MVWGQGTLIFKTSSGDPKIEDRRVDAGPSGAAVGGGGHWCPSHGTDRRRRPRETGCPRSLGAEVKEREGRRKGREGGGTAESRIHWVQHAPGQHLEGVLSELLSLPSSPWGPSHLSQGV